MSAQLKSAVHEVTRALALLGSDPRSPALPSALGSAEIAVDALPRDVTSAVLHRLVVSIEECHHGGIAHSPELAVRARSVCRALRLDPRWTTSAARHLSATTAPALSSAVA